MRCDHCGYIGPPARSTDAWYCPGCRQDESALLTSCFVEVGNAADSLDAAGIALAIFLDLYPAPGAIGDHVVEIDVTRHGAAFVALVNPGLEDHSGQVRFGIETILNY